jgi:hypothetical protein
LTVVGVPGASGRASAAKAADMRENGVFFAFEQVCSEE